MSERSIQIDTVTGDIYLDGTIFVKRTAFDTLEAGDIPLIIGDRRWAGRAGKLIEREPKQESANKTVTTNIWNPTLTKEDVQGF